MSIYTECGKGDFLRETSVDLKFVPSQLTPIASGFSPTAVDVNKARSHKFRTKELYLAMCTWQLWSVCRVD